MIWIIIFGAFFITSIVSLVACMSYKRENDIVRYKIRELLDHFTIRCEKGEHLNDADQVIFSTLIKNRLERFEFDKKLRVWLVLSIIAMWISLCLLLIFMCNCIVL